MKHDKLIQTIRKAVSLSEKDISLCIQYFEPLLSPKNSLVEEEGHIPKYLYFIVSGYMRLFSYNENGEEVTSHINCPPGFITSYASFNNRARAAENLESITDCDLLRINKNDLDYIIGESANIKSFSIAVFQESLLYNENRARELATLSAEQRYKKLSENYPGILLNVPLQYIASYLGMNPKSLSRIRKQSIK